MSIICFVHIKGAIFYVYRRHKNAYNASELYIFSHPLDHDPILWFGLQLRQFNGAPRLDKSDRLKLANKLKSKTIEICC